MEFVLKRLPQTETYHCAKKALNVSFDESPLAAAAVLGNGLRVISSDTIPFCLWYCNVAVPPRHRGEGPFNQQTNITG